MNIQILRSRRKTLSIQVRADTVLVRAPVQASDEAIRKALADHKAWIEANLEKAQARRQAAISAGTLSQAELDRLAEGARTYIPARVAYYAPLVGVTYGRVTIRCQRTRWGSCSAKGNLSFNCLLMLAPPEVIDSVVVHELCHRKEMNHSERFYREVLRVLPDYRQRRQWLKENGPILLERVQGE